MIKVFIIGNLGGDAETRDAGESQVAQFSVASTRKFSDRSGQVKEETEWMRVEYWNPGGVLPYLTKGQQVFVEGRYRTERYADRDGCEKTAVKVIASSVQLLGSKSEGGQASTRRPEPRRLNYPASKYQHYPDTPPAPAYGPEEGPEGDLPF